MSNINSTAKKGQRASVVFCEGVQVDGYQMPDGEFRVGLVGASLALGYSKEWLGRLIANSYNLPKALKGKGFEGSTKDSCNLPETGQTAKTISVKDFLVLIRFADKQGKAKAGALAEALMGLSINDYRHREMAGLPQQPFGF